MDAIPQPQPPASPEEHPRQRVRFTYEKGDAIKFISHQDESRLWERTPAPRRPAPSSTSAASTRSPTSSSPHPSASA